MQVISEIKGKVYEDLIKYASKRCDAVMFVFCKVPFRGKQFIELDKTKNKVKNKLEKSFLKDRVGNEWVFTGRYYPFVGDAILASDILFYKFDDDLVSFLLKKNNLYDWLNPNSPEDIAFFKNGYCWLYSVAHEDICDIYCKNRKEYEELKKIGLEFYENDFEETPKDKLYFEDYTTAESSKN